MLKEDITVTITVSVPICKWLWKATLAEGGEVQGVRLLVHPARLDVQVLEYVHFALETNLKRKKAHQGILLFLYFLPPRFLPPPSDLQILDLSTPR